MEHTPPPRPVPPLSLPQLSSLSSLSDPVQQQTNNKKKKTNPSPIPSVTPMDKGSDSSSGPQPFDFVRRVGRRRCVGPCCVTDGSAQLSSSRSTLPTTRNVSVNGTAIIFVPPECETDWISGTIFPLADDSDSNDDEQLVLGQPSSQPGASSDPGPAVIPMGGDPLGGDTDPATFDHDRSDSPVALKSNVAHNLSLMATEEPIDGCLRCAQGGFQHFKVTINDRRRGTEGHVLVERTGGDMVRFEAPALMFNSEASYVGPAAEPYLRRFFPSVLERLGDDKELLLDCRVCTGRIFISGLECT